MAYTVQLDPPAVATGRTMLNLNAGPFSIGGTAGGVGVDWGQSVLTEYLAQQGQYGSTVADFIIPNRTITIPLLLGGGPTDDVEAAMQSLRQKVALFQREGGWLLRQRSGGPAMYADVVSATLTLPDVWGETGDVEPDVVLTLECLPDFYGDEVTLDVQAATGVFDAVLTQGGQPAVIQGDHPARCRIVVTDTSGNPQLSALWGLRARHYDPASTAALFYEAEALTLLNGATVLSDGLASGGFHVEASSLPAVWVPILSTTPSSGAALTHQGSYRVWARVPAPSSPTQYRFLWGAGSLAAPVTNPAVTVAATVAGPLRFALVDLGAIRLDALAVGASEWFGVVQVMVATPGASAGVDCMYLQPVDDSAGQLRYASQPSSAGSVTVSASPQVTADSAAFGSVAWAPGNLPSGGYAAVNMPASITSHYLEATGFGLAIPAGATIQGIAVTIARAATVSNDIFDAQVRLLQAGVVAGSDHRNGVAWPGNGLYSPVNAAYGGPTDLWGVTWTPAQINATGFGVAVSVASFGAGSVAYVPALSLTVAYALPSGFTVAQDAVLAANATAELRSDSMVRQASAGGPYGQVSQVTGDLPRLPPSGAEGRAVQLMVKPSRGDLDTLPDAGLDTFTTQVRYRPSWIFRP